MNTLPYLCWCIGYTKASYVLGKKYPFCYLHLLMQLVHLGLRKNPTKSALPMHTQTYDYLNAVLNMAYSQCKISECYFLPVVFYFSS